MMGLEELHTSDFIRAFLPHALVVEVADLGFLTGGEREWSSRGIGDGSGLLGRRRSHHRCHDIASMRINGTMF